MKKGTSIQEIEDVLLHYKSLFENDTKDNVKELKDIAKMLVTVATIKKKKALSTNENRKDSLSDPKFTIKDEGNIIKEETKDFVIWKIWRVIEYTNPTFEEAVLRIGYKNITQSPEPITKFKNDPYNDFPKRPSTAYKAIWEIANKMEKIMFLILFLIVQKHFGLFGKKRNLNPSIFD